MNQIRYGIFPNIEQLRHKDIVKVAFKMMKSSPTERASPEEVSNELQKMLQPFSQHPASQSK